MGIKEATSKSFNHQVFVKSYKRIKLSAAQRSVFQRLLGFLIRNDKPFPFSAIKMAELTGYDKRTIFRCLDRLEYCRLIKRHGMGVNRKFSPGSILIKIKTTVTNRAKQFQVNNSTTATLCHKNLNNRDIVSYSKTYSSLKHKDKRSLGTSLNPKEQILFNTKYHEYVKRIQQDRELGLDSGNVEILGFEDWKSQIYSG